MAKFNVAVIGTGFGGLAAAALLSGKKKKVIVVEPGELLSNAEGLYAKDGFCFRTAPALSYGFERGGNFQRLFAGLGILPEISAPLPCYQVALPDRRITVYPEVSDTLDELRREFPRDINALARFYKELHKEGVRSSTSRLSTYLSRHRSAAGFIRKYRFSRELKVFLDVQSLYFYQKPAEDLTLASLITLCDTPPLHLRGGFNMLTSKLYEIILQQGGEVLSAEPSPQLAFRNNRVIGINTAQGVVEARVILLNSSASQRQATLFIGIREEVVPVSMCQEVLFLPDYAFPRDFIALSLSAKDDSAAAPRGMRTLCAIYRSQQNLTADNQTLIKRINRLMPFLDQPLVFAEEQRGADIEEVPLPDISFKPLRSAKGPSRLFRGANKNVYLLNNSPDAPLEAVSAALRFVRKMA